MCYYVIYFFMWNQGKVHPRVKLQQENCNILLHGLIPHGINTADTSFLGGGVNMYPVTMVNMGYHHGTNVPQFESGETP